MYPAPADLNGCHNPHVPSATPAHSPCPQCHPCTAMCPQCHPCQFPRSPVPPLPISCVPSATPALFLCPQCHPCTTILPGTLGTLWPLQGAMRAHPTAGHSPQHCQTNQLQLHTPWNGNLKQDEQSLEILVSGCISLHSRENVLAILWRGKSLPVQS